LDQVGLKTEQCEVTFPGLKRYHRSGWYDYSFWEGRGFTSATGEDDAANTDAARDRSAASEQAIIQVAVVPDRNRDWHPVTSPASRRIGWESVFLGHHNAGTGQRRRSVRSAGCHACQD
jgi:hypothetical protein